MKISKLKTSHIVFLSLGIASLIITIVAFLLVKILFFSPNANSNNFSSNFEEFQMIFFDNPNANTLPKGITIESCDAVLSEDKETYNLRLALKNNLSTHYPVNFQIFAGESYIISYGKDIKNPIYSTGSLSEYLIYPGETSTFETKSVVLGDLETFKQNLSLLYLEIEFNNDIGRVLMPVTFK